MRIRGNDVASHWSTGSVKRTKDVGGCWWIANKALTVPLYHTQGANAYGRQGWLLDKGSAFHLGVFRGNMKVIMFWHGRNSFRRYLLAKVIQSFDAVLSYMFSIFNRSQPHLITSVARQTKARPTSLPYCQGIASQNCCWQEHMAASTIVHPQTIR